MTLKKSHNDIFYGEWRVYLKLGNTLSHKTIMWRFHETCNGKYSVNSYYQSGKLTEVTDSQSAVETKFYYYSFNRLLYIDRSGYTSDGFCDFCENDIYYVLKASKKRVRLIDTTDTDIDAIKKGGRNVLTVTALILTRKR